MELRVHDGTNVMKIKWCEGGGGKVVTQGPRRAGGSGWRDPAGGKVHSQTDARAMDKVGTHITTPCPSFVAVATVVYTTIVLAHRIVGACSW